MVVWLQITISHDRLGNYKNKYQRDHFVYSYWHIPSSLSRGWGRPINSWLWLVIGHQASNLLMHNRYRWESWLYPQSSRDRYRTKICTLEILQVFCSNKFHLGACISSRIPVWYNCCCSRSACYYRTDHSIDIAIRLGLLCGDMLIHSGRRKTHFLGWNIPKKDWFMRGLTWVHPPASRIEWTIRHPSSSNVEVGGDAVSVRAKWCTMIRLSLVISMGQWRALNQIWYPLTLHKRPGTTKTHHRFGVSRWSWWTTNRKTNVWPRTRWWDRKFGTTSFHKHCENTNSVSAEYHQLERRQVVDYNL